MGFPSVNSDVVLIWLVEAYNRTRKDGAPGVDGQTAKDYGLTLLENLESLLDRAKSGAYRAPPVRRGANPQEGGEKGGPPARTPPGEKNPPPAGRRALRALCYTECCSFGARLAALRRV